MINFKSKVSFNIKKVLRKTRQKMASSLRHAAAILRKDIQASLSKPGGGKPSRPGTPPHLQSGKLKRSIYYGMDGDNVVVIGSQPRSWGWYGRIHEHGATLKTKEKILKKDYRPGDEGPLVFKPNPPRGTIRTYKQAARAIKINKWLAKKANQRRWYARKQGHDVDEYVSGYEPEYVGEEDQKRYVPARPFVRPALMRNLDVIPYSFREMLAS